MKTLNLLLGSLTVFTVAVAGCAGSSGSALSAEAKNPGGAPVDEVAQPGYGGESFDQPAATGAPAPAAPAADGDFGESEGGGAEMVPRQRREDRRGLATVWGEARTSRVSTAPFFREEPSRPFSVAKLFYNDATGARSMARRRGFVSVDDSTFSVAGGALTVSVVDGSGRPYAAFRASSGNFVVGEHGERYVIHIENQSSVRMEVVATVDGLDVIDGKDGSFGKRGYVLAPFSTLDIDGFRQSMDRVASFRFGEVENSYAARKGKARNVGVIGIAFFQERGSSVPIARRDVRRRETADPFPARFARPPMHHH